MQIETSAFHPNNDDPGSIPPDYTLWVNPTTATTHIAIQERMDGKMVEWTEHVTDEQYRR